MRRVEVITVIVGLLIKIEILIVHTVLNVNLVIKADHVGGLFAFKPTSKFEKATPVQIFAQDEFVADLRSFRHVRSAHCEILRILVHNRH